MKKFKGMLVKNVFCDVRGGYEDADIKVNHALMKLQEDKAKIEAVQIVSADKGYAIFTILYEGELEIIDEDGDDAVVEEAPAEVVGPVIDAGSTNDADVIAKAEAEAQASEGAENEAKDVVVDEEEQKADSKTTLEPGKNVDGTPYVEPDTETPAGSEATQAE